ncbi:unnamed protein product [Linum trigynum]|uniref:Uncharacterized protein n=1 Tax=Linum trigynum TaxID=586398 RepID=A0AAV2DDA3_9ROSI
MKKKTEGKGSSAKTLPASRLSLPALSSAALVSPRRAAQVSPRHASQVFPRRAALYPQQPAINTTGDRALDRALHRSNQRSWPPQ